MALTDFKAESRKLYREYTNISVSPVSKGTWTVTATHGEWGDRKRGTEKWTGLSSLVEVEEALASALDWIAERAAR